MISIHNPSMRAGGASINENSRFSFVRTDSALGIYDAELPIQPCELSLVVLKIAPSNPSLIPSYRAHLRYTIAALNDENTTLLSQQYTYQLGESVTRTSPIHTFVAPKGTTKIKVQMGSGVDLTVSKYSEVSFNESAN